MKSYKLQVRKVTEKFKSYETWIFDFIQYFPEKIHQMDMKAWKLKVRIVADIKIL